MVFHQLVALGLLEALAGHFRNEFFEGSLQEVEWINLGTNIAESRMNTGFLGFLQGARNWHHV